MNDPVIYNNIPLINISGIPALCKENGCCGDEVGVECVLCASLVPEVLRFTINSTWTDGNYVKGPFDPECTNCTDCSELAGLSFMVPFTGSVAIPSYNRCSWYGVFELNDLTSCLHNQAVVFVRLNQAGGTGNPVILTVSITFQTDNQQPIGCGFNNQVTVTEERDVSDLPSWDCNTMQTTVATPARFHANDPTCEVTGGSITIGSV